jgi:hypothetical protein
MWASGMTINSWHQESIDVLLTLVLATEIRADAQREALLPEQNVQR